MVAAPRCCGCRNRLRVTMPLPTSNDGHDAPHERELARRQRHWSTVLSEGSPQPTPNPGEPRQAPPSDSAGLARTSAQPTPPRHAEPRQPLPGPLLPPLLPDNARIASLPTGTRARLPVVKLAGFDALLAVAKEQHMHFAAETPASTSSPEVAGQQLERQVSPRLRSLLGTSSTSADVPAEDAEIRTLANRRPPEGAPLWPVLSIAASSRPPHVQASSALLATTPSHLPEVGSCRPGTSAGVDSQVQTGASAPLASYTHGAPKPGRGPDDRAVVLPLPRLAGLPVSPPVSVGSLLRNRSVQEHSWTPSGPQGGSNPPSSMAAVTPTPLPERFSDETIPFGAANIVSKSARVGPRLSHFPSLSFPPGERAPSAALSLLAETSNEQPPLQLGRKRSRDSPTIPLRGIHEEQLAGGPHMKAAPGVLREITASSVRLNPPVAGRPTPLGTVQPRKTATSEPLRFAGSLRTPIGHQPLRAIGAEPVKESQQDTTAASRSPPLVQPALPSTGQQVTEGDLFGATHASVIPRLAQETTSRLGPLSTSSNPPLIQSDRVVMSGSDNTAFRSSRPTPEFPLPVVRVHGHLDSSSAQLTDPGAGQEVAPLAARGLSSGPTQSARQGGSGSSVAQSTFELKIPKEEAQVSWLCDRCGRPYKWKQTLQAHRRYVRTGLT